MTESTQSVCPPDGFMGSSAVGLPASVARPSVRELLTELAALEDATRGRSRSHGATPCASTDEWLAAVARQQEIIDELHRRGAGGAPPI